jgi:hypothetical protein
MNDFQTKEIKNKVWQNLKAKKEKKNKEKAQFE